MANREHVIRKVKEWARANPERNKERSKRWQLENRERIAEVRAKRRLVDMVGRIRRLAKAAERRGKFEYTLKDRDLKALVSQLSLPCPITGLDYTFDVPGEKFAGLLLSPSLDRINSSKGYVPGNVRVVSYWANIAKSKHSDDTLLSMCSAVVKNARRKRAETRH